MILLNISVDGRCPHLHGSPQALRQTMSQALARSTGPVTFLIHGYKYAPGAGLDCPHCSLMSLKSDHPNPRIVSWPRHLRPGGLVIGFGWQARGSLWGAYDRAAEAAYALAELTRLIRCLAPGRSQNYFAHSLGARVALNALEQLDAEDVQAVILLAAAEYRANAERALMSPAGRCAHVLHVTSGENDLYDFMFERIVSPPQRGDRAFGSAPLAHAQALMLDDPRMLTRLAQMGFRIAEPARRICHWSPYLRPGVFALYRALLRGDLPFADLTTALPKHVHQRWSRLIARRNAPAPLPLAKDASI